MSNYLNPEDGSDAGYEDGTTGEEAFDPNLLDVQPLPAPGDYPAVVCTDASLQKSKKGNAMVVVTLSSNDPEHAAESKFYIVNSRGSSRYEEGLACFGLTKDQVKTTFVEGGPSALAKLFVGKIVSAVGKHDTYLGNKNFKFDTIAAPAEGAGFRAFGTDE